MGIERLQVCKQQRRWVGHVAGVVQVTGAE